MVEAMQGFELFTPALPVLHMLTVSMGYNSKPCETHTLIPQPRKMRSTLLQRRALTIPSFYVLVLILSQTSAMETLRDGKSSPVLPRYARFMMTSGL